MNKPLASLFAKHKAIVLFDCETTGTCPAHEAQIQREVEKLLTRMSMRVLAVRKAAREAETVNYQPLSGRAASHNRKYSVL